MQTSSRKVLKHSKVTELSPTCSFILCGKRSGPRCVCVCTRMCVFMEHGSRGWVGARILCCPPQFPIAYPVHMPYLAQSSSTLCNPLDCSSPGSFVHEIFQARILVQVAISYSKDLSSPGIEPTSPVSPALQVGS